MKPSEKSVLFRTNLSGGSDVQNSGGVLSITGLFPVSKKLIKSITQLKYRAEIPQVVTVGGVNTSWTPVGSTVYAVSVWDRNRTVSGYQETQKTYKYVTSSDLSTEGATAVLQREYINAAIVTAINADSTNHAIAASLGSGNGFTITDDGGYYPAHSQTQTNVRFVNEDVIISGYAKTNVATTTAGLTSIGVGATLATFAPVMDFMTGNLISGTLTAPPLTVQASGGAPGLAAQTGQNYDGYALVELHEVPAHGEGNNKLCYINEIQTIWADNGTGSSTSNLTNYIAFEKEMLRAIFELYKNDPSATYDFFDQALIASYTYPTTGAAISTTDNVVMAVATANGVNANTFYVNPIGTHTLLTPIVSTGGLAPYLDVTTQEGVELSVPNLTQCPKEFTVGKTEFSLYCRFTFTGIAATDWKTLSIGFRKKAAYAVDQTAYEAASVATACLGVPLDTGAAPIINMITGPGTAGALTNTSTAVTPTAASTHDFWITVDISGNVRFYVNGVDKTPLLAATYTFTAGLKLMPFISFRHGAGTAAGPLVVAMAAVPSINWRVN